MQKKWMMLVVVVLLLLLGFGGCGSQKSAENSEETENKDEDITEICAYIKEIKGNTLVIDPVEFISSEDSDEFEVINIQMMMYLMVIISTMKR